MNAIGGQEILFPALLPRGPYETTNRWTEYGDGVFRLQDRRGNDYLLGPTHEELFTLTVKGEYSSYKDFPVLLYQIQTKYRDEARPRAGILRGREFVMKDSYSFDVDDDGLRAATTRTARPTSGSSTRSASATSSSPRCPARWAAARPRSSSPRARSARTPSCAAWSPGTPPTSRPSRPRRPTRCRSTGCPRPRCTTPRTPRPSPRWWTGPTPPISDREVTAADTLKNVLLKTRVPGGEWELLAVGVPGDREVDEKRLGAALEPAEYALLDDADFAKNPFLVKGYIGPKALLANGVRYLVDPRVVDGTSWITGADAPGKHVVGLVAGRDFTADGTIEAAEVRDGDPSPDGAGALVSARGIEIGHIFQLGRKYTDAFDVDVLGENGKPVRLTMGSYGIGVSRLVAVIAEQHHDELGLRWPSSVSPFDVARGDRQQGRGRPRGRRRAGRRAGPARARGAARRPEGLAGREVQGRRAARGAVDRRGRPRLGRRRGRAAQPVHRRDARRSPVADAAASRRASLAERCDCPRVARLLAAAGERDGDR